MILKQLFSHVMHPTRTAQVVLSRKAARKVGTDVRSLEPTSPMTNAEKAERYRSGRFAEMTDAQAGL